MAICLCIVGSKSLICFPDFPNCLKFGKLFGFYWHISNTEHTACNLVASFWMSQSCPSQIAYKPQQNTFWDLLEPVFVFSWAEKELIHQNCKLINHHKRDILQFCNAKIQILRKIPTHQNYLRVKQSVSTNLKGNPFKCFSSRNFVLFLLK